MNNHRLLKGLLAAILSGVAVCSYAQKVFTLEEIFEIAEEKSIQLKPSFTNQEIAVQEHKPFEEPQPSVIRLPAE